MLQARWRPSLRPVPYSTPTRPQPALPPPASARPPLACGRDVRQRHQVRQRVSQMASHAQPHGAMRSVGLWRGAAQLLAATVVRWHAEGPGPAGADAAAGGGGAAGLLEVTLFAASELQHDPAHEARPTEARQLQLRRAHSRLLLALCIDAALSLHEAAGRRAAAPPAPGSDRSCVLVLAHVPPGRDAFWRQQGFVEPRELPREWRAAALGAVEAELVASFEAETEAESRPALLALVAKPWVDYVASAAQGLGDGRG